MVYVFSQRLWRIRWSALVETLRGNIMPGKRRFKGFSSKTIKAWCKKYQISPWKPYKIFKLFMLRWKVNRQHEYSLSPFQSFSLYRKCFQNTECANTKERCPLKIMLTQFFILTLNFRHWKPHAMCYRKPGFEEMYFWGNEQSIWWSRAGCSWKTIKGGWMDARVVLGYVRRRLLVFTKLTHYPRQVGGMGNN